jgi:hypothetical protein
MFRQKDELIGQSIFGWHHNVNSAYLSSWGGQMA